MWISPHRVSFGNRWQPCKHTATDIFFLHDQHNNFRSLWCHGQRVPLQRAALTNKQDVCFLRYSKYSVCLSQDHYVKKYPQIMLKIHEVRWGRRGGAGEHDAVFLPLCPALPVYLIFSILFSVFFLFLFFLIQPTPPTSHILCMQRAGGEKRRLHSNYPAGTAHEGYSGCIKFITDQRDRFWTLLRLSLCFYIHSVSCATPWSSGVAWTHFTAFCIQVRRWRYFPPHCCLLTIWEVEVERL